MNIAIRTTAAETASEPADALDHLADALFHRMGSDGVYARTALYEDMVERLAALITRHREANTEVMRFPPVMSRAQLEKSRYLKSFPNVVDWVCALRWEFDVDSAGVRFVAVAGQMTPVRQTQHQLKSELRHPRHYEAGRTACMNFNYHRDHFGTARDIRDANGEPAHTGCLAFG